MRNILVIDDDSLVRASIKTMLNDLNHNVDVAKDGLQGVELFKRNKYDMVITDIVMPEKEGFTTISELKAIDESVKIIAISGGARNGVGSYLPVAKSIGAKEILYKPFDEQELDTTIHKIFSN